MIGTGSGAGRGTDQLDGSVYERAGLDQNEALLAVCRLVGEAMGIAIETPPGAWRDGSPRDRLLDIATSSRVRTRPVVLRGTWWRADNGPLLAYLTEGGWPVALLPAARGRYFLCDPVQGSRRPVTPEVAASLQPFAHTLYRSFPEHPLSALDLLRAGLRGCRNDIAMLLLHGLAVGMLGMLPAMATALVFDQIVPAGSRSQALQMAVLLLVGALAAAAFQFGRAIALLRIETKSTNSLQAALWDRLLRLPVRFFRAYSSGDLVVRAMGIETIRELVTGAASSAIIAGLFSMFNFGLMYYYSVPLALLATALLSVALAAIVVASLVQLRYEKQLSEIQGKVSGLVLQLVTGVAKLRAAGAERRAFEVWAARFHEQRRLAFMARSVTIKLAVFSTAFAVLSLLILYGRLWLADDGDLSRGSFLGFLAAFGVCFAALQELTSALTSLLKVAPIFERAKPILETPPEVRAAQAHPGELRGVVEVLGVFFRYRPDLPAVLEDVSFEARPNELVAIVGPSGSGKSTLFRLLLGFETPEFGVVRYDGQDLAALDVEAVRRQIGTVAQNSTVMPGDILRNIIGSSLVPVEQAWQAAALAGLDEDIRRMPMGMYTIVGAGGATFSGGQRQRLLIARALVRMPKILLFDEATSALDNRTQEFLSSSLERLQSTRIVIAHRLSTIARADRIYVLDKGRVVQKGTYAELAGQEGLFRQLIQRQLA